MNNFYKIDYESYEEYKELIRDKDLINIFQRQEKIQENRRYKHEEEKSNLVKFFPNCKKKHTRIFSMCAFSFYIFLGLFQNCAFIC